MRIRTIDACLQRRQKQWTLEALREACENALYDYEGIDSISIRTIQRDIELMRSDKLGYNAPIVVKNRKYYEYEDPNYSITQLPLSKRDLAELSSAIEIIRHYNGFQSMGGQEDLLARMQDKVQTLDSRKQIVYIDTNKQLKGLKFLAPLYDHISKQEPIIVNYHSFKSVKENRFYISPYILKEYNNRWFLIGYSKQMKNVQTIALDRIISVEKDTKHKFIENMLFNTEQYLDEMVGVTRDIHSKKTHVILKIDALQAPYVLTKPLHCSQVFLKEFDDKSILISLDIIVNFELERLILGFGSHIEVLSPRNLRQRIASQILISASKYQNLK